MTDYLHLMCDDLDATMSSLGEKASSAANLDHQLGPCELPSASRRQQDRPLRAASPPPV